MTERPPHYHLGESSREKAKDVRVRRARDALQRSYEQGRVLWTILATESASIFTLVVFRDVKITLATELVTLPVFVVWQLKERRDQAKYRGELEELGSDPNHWEFLPPGRRLRRGTYGRNRLTQELENGENKGMIGGGESPDEPRT